METPLDSLAIAELLNRLSLSGDITRSIVSALPESAIGVLLYGSYSRGDFTPESDIDLLILRSCPAGTTQFGRNSLSTYTPDQLASAAGTLFGMHLARDGVALHDTDDQLGALLERMWVPSPEELFQRIRHFGAILDVNDHEGAEYAVGLTRVARYLLRTAIYALAIAQGDPCFSVRELSVRFNDPDLVMLLSADPVVALPASIETMSELRRRLNDVVGPFAENRYGSFRNLIVAEWYEDAERATLATLALVRDDGVFDYAALPKVLL